MKDFSLLKESGKSLFKYNYEPCFYTVHFFLTGPQDNRYNYHPTEENQLNALYADLSSTLSHGLVMWITLFAAEIA